MPSLDKITAILPELKKMSWAERDVLSVIITDINLHGNYPINYDDRDQLLTQWQNKRTNDLLDQIMSGNLDPRDLDGTIIGKLLLSGRFKHMTVEFLRNLAKNMTSSDRELLEQLFDRWADNDQPDSVADHVAGSPKRDDYNELASNATASETKETKPGKATKGEEAKSEGSASEKK